MLLFLCLTIAAAALNAPAGTKIESLPDYNGPALSMYSGYVEVNQTNGRALFYWLVEATDVDPLTAPLIFWYQGGPGCSGLGGLLTENGPLMPDVKNGGLTTNPLAWTQFANVVYLEQPAFVGFSYSNTSSDTNTGDVQATIDNKAFVEGFLQAYPDYQGRPTWFTGESYGGFYVPSLAAAILEDSSTGLFKQFEGFMIGNPVFFCGTMGDVNVQLNLYYWHGLVSFGNYNQWQQNCVNSQNDPSCQELWTQIQKEIGVIDQELKRNVAVKNQPSLDPDCLYQDFCTGNGTLSYVATVPDNCMPLGSLVANYLNRRDVQTAIHAQGPNGGLPLTWSECTSRINYDILGDSMVPLYANFQKQKPGLKVLVYSGDIDIATVPFAYTQPCLAELKATQTKAWGPWFVNGQTAGYVEQFDSYTFATVKGAGHEAPEYQPLSSINMIKRFMTSQSLDSPADAPSQFRSLHQHSRSRTQGEVLRNMVRKAGQK